MLSVPTGSGRPLHHPPPVSLTWTSLLARPPPVKHHRLLQPRLQWGETPSHRSPLSGRGGGTHLLFSLNLWWGSALGHCDTFPSLLFIERLFLWRWLLPQALYSTTLQSIFSQHRDWHCHENRLIKTIQTITYNLYVSFKSATVTVD